jgi:hypothetical protein
MILFLRHNMVRLNGFPNKYYNVETKTNEIFILNLMTNSHLKVLDTHH